MADKELLKGIKQVKASTLDETEKGYLYLVRDKDDSTDEGHLELNGKKYAYSIDCGEYEPDPDAD